MRLITFKPKRGGAPRLGVVLEGERVLWTSGQRPNARASDCRLTPLIWFR